MALALIKGHLGEFNRDVNPITVVVLICIDAILRNQMEILKVLRRINVKALNGAVSASRN